MGYQVRILPFLSKLSIICNFSYTCALLYMFFKWAHYPIPIASFFAIVGLEMAPFVNLIFVCYIIVILVKKNPINLPQWQIITNSIFFGFQIISLFI